MNLVESKTVQCPCCGELIQVLIDLSIPEQEYIEDCQVCCRPMILQVLADAEGLREVRLRREVD